MRVLMCSKVSRALSRTSVESAEVVSRGIGLVTTAHSVPTGIHPELCENRITGKTQSSRREWAEVTSARDPLSDHQIAKMVQKIKEDVDRLRVVRE